MTEGERKELRRCLATELMGSVDRDGIWVGPYAIGDVAGHEMWAPDYSLDQAHDLRLPLIERYDKQNVAWSVRRNGAVYEAIFGHRLRRRHAAADTPALAMSLAAKKWTEAQEATP